MDTSFISKSIEFTLIIILSFSCFPVKSDRAQKDGISQSQTLGNVIHSITREHYFTSMAGKDKFKIELIGEDVLNGQVKFEIFTSQMKLIYSITFKSSELLGYEINPGTKKNEMEDYIINRMDHFMDETNFKPAIDSDEYDPVDYDMIDINIWQEIKKNNNAIGFYYVLGEENMVWIVFLKSQNRIIKYKSCC